MLRPMCNFTPNVVRLWRSEPTERWNQRENRVNGKQRQKHSCCANTQKTSQRAGHKTTEEEPPDVSEDGQVVP